MGNLSLLQLRRTSSITVKARAQNMAFLALGWKDRPRLSVTIKIQSLNKVQEFYCRIKLTTLTNLSFAVSAENALLASQPKFFQGGENKGNRFSLP